jgi:acyl-CoA synthetase (NDP forming)
MTGAASARGPKAVAKFVRPRSVAIIGMSARPLSAGQNVFQGLQINGFKGDIYLVGRSAEPINGLPVLPSPEELPEGVDLAVFTLPAAGVRDAVAACVKRQVGSAMVFAAGFAEAGQRDVQEEVTKTARDGGLAIVGPNCLGFTNNVDHMMLHMLFAREAKRFNPGDKPGVAFVGQSGGMLGHMQRAAEARRMPISYAITTGNEAGLDLADFVEFMVEDAATRVIVLYGEQIRRPAEFLAACAKARAAGKPVLLLHPGRSAKARVAAASHTGALVGDHGAMLVNMARAGVLVVDTVDELMDVSELVTRYPEPPAKGPALLTASGAYVALVNDFSETIGLEWPPFTAKTMEILKKALPSFANPGNPLDTTAGAVPGTIPIATKALLDDENIGMLYISYPIDGRNGIKTIGEFMQGMEGNTKPVLAVALGDSSTLAPDLHEACYNGPFVFSRSSDRSLRAVGHYTAYGRLLERLKTPAAKPAAFANLPKLGKGAQPEWQGKKLLAAAGIPVPAGELAKSVDEAATVAKRIGYPVALKAQAAALTHKTEAGAVMLNIGDEAGLRSGWNTMMSNVKRAAPDITLEGALVEKMSARGLELMVGAKRDPAWGPVLMVGLGGIWLEALGDVRLLPAEAGAEQVIEELQRLRAAALLSGFRGAPPVDVRAVARAAGAIGRIMLTMPEVIEIDVNPLVALPEGQGVLALDALIVTAP